MLSKALIKTELKVFCFVADTYACPILGPDTFVLDFWEHFLWGSNQSGLPHSHYRGECNERSLRSTSGATPADLFESQFAANLVLFTCFKH